VSDPGEADRRALIRAEHDRQRRYLIALIGLAVSFGLVGAGGLIAILVPAEERPFPGWVLILAILIGVVGTGFFGRAMLAARANLGTDRLRVGESYGDGLQRQRNQALVFMALPLILILVNTSSAAWKLASGQGEAFHWMTASLAALLPVMLGLTLAGIGSGEMGRMKRHLDDEMTQGHRKQALSLAYVVMLAGTTGIYLLGLWYPVQAVVGIPIVLALAVQVGAVRFVLLERRADRDG